MSSQSTVDKRAANRIRHDSRSIQTDLERKISSRHWAPGEKLPSRRQLANEYGVALATVERACSNLITSGMLVASGRGTLVGDAKTSLAQDRAAYASLSRPHAGIEGAVIGVIDELEFNGERRPDGNEWTFPVISSLEGVIGSMGGRTVPFNWPSNSPSICEVCEALIERGVDAIVIVALNSIISINKEIGRLAALPKPLICVTSYDLSLPIPTVFFDNWMAGYQASEHLLASGSERIIFLGPSAHPWSLQRLNGARSAAEHYALPGENVRVLFGDSRFGVSPYNEAELCDQVDELLRDNLDRVSTTGIVAANDSLAVAVQRALDRHGLHAGRDYGLTGFDNAPQSRKNDITTLRPPLEEIGAETAAFVASYVHGDRRNTRACLRCQLIVRGSSVRFENDSQSMKKD